MYNFRYTIFIMFFLILLSIVNVKANKKLNKDEIIKEQKEIEGIVLIGCGYEIHCFLEDTEKGYNIIVVNMMEKIQEETSFDPIQIIWHIARYTNKTTWHSDTLKIWYSPIKKEGWGILTKEGRAIASKTGKQSVDKAPPAFGEEVKAKFFLLKRTGSKLVKFFAILVVAFAAVVISAIMAIIRKRRSRIKRKQSVKKYEKKGEQVNQPESRDIAGEEKRISKFKVGDPVIYTDGVNGVGNLIIKGVLDDGTYWVGSTLRNVGLNLTIPEEDLILDKTKLKK